MSVEAMAYVLPLTECPDGADLNAGMKGVLMVLANCHNPHYRVAWPSQPTIARYSRLSEDSVRRHLRYLQDHCLIEQRRPDSFGAGIKCSYVFLFLDDPERLQKLLAQKAEGLQGAPLFSPGQRVAEGSQSTAPKGGKRVAPAPRIKDYPQSKTSNPEPCASGAGISTDCPTWKALPDGLRQKVLREVKSMQQAAVGTALYAGDATAETIASHERNVMLRACSRAGIWQDRADKIGDEFYRMALHEEAAKRNQRLEAPGYGDDAHA